MGKKARSRPERLPAKLLAIRRALGVNQTEMAKLLESATLNKRLSEYESGRREPDLLVVLKYAKLGRVPVESLIDDNLDLHF
jgi:transcriptional regulator with XRE-family HTH domain